MTVLQNTQKMADMNINVEEDLSQETQKIRMILLLWLKDAQRKGTLGFYEKGQVVVNGKNLQPVLFVKNYPVL
jgi:hypothetical protein